MKKILAFSIMLIAFSAGAFAQSTDTEPTTASAVIVGPLALTKVSDMDFGTIAVTGTAGTVVLGTDNSRTAVGPALVPPAAGVRDKGSPCVSPMPTGAISISGCWEPWRC